jgi:hypothetical protein
LLMADVNRRFLGGGIDIHCIEPFPPPFLRRPVDGSPVWSSDVSRASAADVRRPRAGDLLFVDSSHVAKTDSDVNFLFFEVFPRLAPGAAGSRCTIFFCRTTIHLRGCSARIEAGTSNTCCGALLMHSSGLVLFGCSYAFLAISEAGHRRAGEPRWNRGTEAAASGCAAR